MKWPAQAERRVRVCEPLAPDNSPSSLRRLQFGILCFLVRGMAIRSNERGSSDSALLAAGITQPSGLAGRKRDLAQSAALDEQNEALPLQFPLQCRISRLSKLGLSA